MLRHMQATTKPIQAKIIIPGSACITNRALLLAALADGVSEIRNLRLNENTRALINALHQVGIVVKVDEITKSCIIAGGNGKFPQKQTTVWCNNSKSTAEMLSTACAATPGVYYFDGATSLRSHDMHEALQTFCRQGMQLIPNDARALPFTILGADNFEGGEITLNESYSDETISTLLIISPYARNQCHLLIKNNLHHLYLDMTCSMMAEFGVLVHRIRHHHFSIPVPQRYVCRDYTIEPDLGLAAYFFAAAAITGGEIQIQAVKKSLSMQDEVKIISMLEKMGCEIIETTEHLIIKGPKKLCGIEISMREFTDTFAALAAIAPFANSPTRITHIENATPAELIRLSQICKEFEKINIRIETEEQSVTIYPSTPIAGQVDAQEDYHVAMALAVIGLQTPNITISNTECIAAVYPDFFAAWDSLVDATPLLATTP